VYIKLTKGNVAMTKLLDILGCRYPIIQGPIGHLNDPKDQTGKRYNSGNGFLKILI